MFVYSQSLAPANKESPMHKRPVPDAPINEKLLNDKERSDKLMNYFLIGYFLFGLILATFYATWLIAFAVGGSSLLVYYSVKSVLPGSSLYQYILSAIFGIFMIQYIYQMHGLPEMHFFAFIGSALLITYQKWKLQIPILITVITYHILFSYPQNAGIDKAHFVRATFDSHISIFHILLWPVFFFICGLWSYQLKKYHEAKVLQALKVAELEKENRLSVERRRDEEILTEKNTILESIGDAFFAVDVHWEITYWNNMAEKILRKTKKEALNVNFWDVFPHAVGSEFYKKCHGAIRDNQIIHFEDYFDSLDKWYEISAYPSVNGLSVYFNDVTERKQSEALLKESEKRYNELFQLTPLPMWVFDIVSLHFLDVNEAAMKNYGYTREEFLSMTIKNIRPEKDIPRLSEALTKHNAGQQFIFQGAFKHKKKNGELIDVDIRSNNIQFNGKKARIIIATDVTERLMYINAIEQKNKKLLEISWMQSHIIRAPLTRIMALIPLIKDEKENPVERDLLLGHLSASANELDEVIKNITDKTNIVDDEL